MTYPNATIRRGPPSKQGYDDLNVNTIRGVICHSMVGGLQAGMGELDNLNRRASWHYSVLKDGTVLAHYEDYAVTWHSDSKRENGRLIGIEHEGGLSPHNEPLTLVQRAASVALVRWLSRAYGFPLVRRVGLFEHREIAATACPSGRIPWEFYTEAPLEGDDDMKPLLVWDSTRRQVHLIGPFGAVWITQAADVAALSALYGPMTVALTASTIDALAAR